MLSRVFIFAFVVACAAAATVSLHPLSDAFIEHINSKQSTWKAGRNFPLNTSLRRLVGAHPTPKNISLRTVEHDAGLIDSLPENFDPRQKWPHCPSLNEIRDQASCGSCWAFGAVTAMTDRICISSNGSKQFHVSAEDLISCCTSCGSCHGGSPVMAWIYWSEDGLVSGGNYNSHQGCRPYPFPSCETLPHPPKGNGFNTTEMKPCINYEKVKTPKCAETCVNKKISYENDKVLGEEPYAVEGEDGIKAELFKNGPVETGFGVFEDFFNYKSGVYKHTAGEFIYGHAVKILGWGVENGVKYWLVANSWNRSWGDNGFFKILRGENHLGIESQAFAGVPII